MMAARVIGPICFILLVVFSDPGPAGLAGRILAATLSLWISALAITLIYNTRHALSSPASVPGRVSGGLPAYLNWTQGGTSSKLVGSSASTRPLKSVTAARKARVARRHSP